MKTMLCQNCKEKQATVHFVKVINGKRTEMHLCEKCAPIANQEFPSIESFDITVSDILGSFFGGAASAPQSKCELCGTTFDEFSHTGKLGCSDCYDVFGQQLANPLKRIQGASSHKGKTPKRAENDVDEITNLKKQLDAAIMAEDFENAAILRDKIKTLEGSEGK